MNESPRAGRISPAKDERARYDDK